MSDPDPVAAALAGLLSRRRELAEQGKRLDLAIKALQALVGDERHPPSASAASFEEIPIGARPSVKQMMLRLLWEEDQDWSVSEILEEYRKRGTPIQAKDPSNALRAALAEENKAGSIYRVAPGRYKAAKFRLPLERLPTESLDELLSGGHHPEADAPG